MRRRLYFKGKEKLFSGFQSTTVLTVVYFCSEKYIKVYTFFMQI